MSKKSKFIVFILCIALFIGLFPYGIQETTSKAADYGISNPRVVEGGNVTWDCIYFGSYWQNVYQPKQVPDNLVSGNKYVDSDGSEMIYIEGSGTKVDENGDKTHVNYHVYYKKEPIKWRVLEVNGNDAFLLADQCLDAKPYNNEAKDVVWEDSSLRKWLINDFYNTAFTNNEQNSIIETDWANENGDSVKDKISILSLTETCNAAYGFNGDSKTETETRQSKVTAYAPERGAYIGDNGNGLWWLRSYNDWLAKRIYWVKLGGNIEPESDFFLDDTKAVRPCIHLDLSSDTWSKADTVTATGGTFPIPTPAPIQTPTPTATIKPTTIPRPTYDTSKIGTIQPIKPTPTIIPTPTPSPRTVTAPSRPTKVKAKNKKKKSVTLSWKKVKRATGYQVQYATNEAFSRKSKTTKKTKIVFKKLKKKRTYSFRVRAYVLNNKKKIYSKWSKVKRIKIKK